MFNFSSVNGESTYSVNNVFGNCPNLSNTSLNNIMQSLITINRIWSQYKNLKTIGLTQEQAQICTTLSNYQAFVNAGWTTGY